jgi:hypothetical protein
MLLGTEDMAPAEEAVNPHALGLIGRPREKLNGYGLYSKQ